jgi:predicted lipoprotein
MIRPFLVLATAWTLSACGAPPKPERPLSTAEPASAPTAVEATPTRVRAACPRLVGTVTHANRRVCMVRVDDNPDGASAERIEAGLPAWVVIRRDGKEVARVQAVAYEPLVDALLCQLGPRPPELRIGDRAETTRTVQAVEQFGWRTDREQP